jgi:hypothetical protein
MEPIGQSAYLLREARDGAARAAALELLSAAGWPRPMLAHWASIGVVLELYDPADEIPCGAAIVTAARDEDGTYELRAWDATVQVEDPHVVSRLVGAIADALRRSGGRHVVASVVEADRHRITLLLEAGFRVAEIDRGAASHERPCVGSCDLVWMDQDL